MPCSLRTEQVFLSLLTITTTHAGSSIAPTTPLNRPRCRLHGPPEPPLARLLSFLLRRAAFIILSVGR